MEPYTVVIAAQSPESARDWQDKLPSTGCRILGIARDGVRALELIHIHRPDVVLADAILPLWDGTELARRILISPLTVRPALILACPAESFLHFGGKWKGAGIEAMRRPFDAEALESAIERQSVVRRSLPAPLLRVLADTLDSISIPEHPGREYLMRAAQLVFFDERLLSNKTRILYPLAGEPYGADGVRTERAIRHVIDTAWKRGAIERQYALFRGTIDAQRGKPTTGEMIARLADVLRQEATKL